MIETLTLRNFKVLRAVDVKLRPLTLIVGPNASGKSTILEALAREEVSSPTRVARMAVHGHPWHRYTVSSVLADLYREHPERFRDVMNRLRRIIPGTTRGVRPLPAELGAWAASMGSGTLIALELLTVLLSPEPPRLVLIDDLERGLHPKALGELIHQFRLLQEQNPELQIVATSHSPYLLDYVKAEEVLLTSLDQDGYAVVKSLTEHSEYERWKDLMAPGEFWSTVGESWVTAVPAGARPDLTASALLSSREG